MFLHRRPLARFRWQEAEPAIYLQPYIPDDLGELAASEMPQLGSTQGLLDMMGGGSSAEEEGGPPRKQRRLEETALGARPAPPEEVAEEIAPTEVDPASSPASVPSSPASAPRAAVVPLHAPAATPGVSASASAEADSDDEFLQDLWRTPARSAVADIEQIESRRPKQQGYEKAYRAKKRAERAEQQLRERIKLQAYWQKFSGLHSVGGLVRVD